MILTYYPWAGIDITVKSQTGCTAEDILRSIPSKAAEDAYNILKGILFQSRSCFFQFAM